MWWIYFLSCSTGSKQTDSTEEIVMDSGQSEARFSVFLMADPHLTGAGEAQERLQRTVAWVNTNAELYDLSFVMILGDVAWGEGLQLSKQILDELVIPYVPIIGDNEIHAGDEQRFGEVFSSVFERNADFFDDWQDSFQEVWNPEYDRYGVFYNSTFSYKGVRFMGLDWASRSSHAIQGEMGDLHAFEGGTLSWLDSTLATLELEQKPIFMASHIPMYVNVGAFDTAEMETLEVIFASYADRFQANFAGHYHTDVENEQNHYDLYVLDAIWDDEIRFRILDIRLDAGEVTFETTLMEIE